MMFCAKCKVETARMVSGRCRPCKLKYNREYRRANPSKILGYNRKWRKADPEKYRALRHAWSGLPKPTRLRPSICECCGRLPGKRALSLDHCHSTKQFRGWLCNNCNRGLGLIGDTCDSLQRALAYLLRAENAATK